MLSGEKPEDIERAGNLLRAGGLVGIPTETVYGLAANGLDNEAVKRIFEAKGRPADNPLIVHIARFEQIYELVQKVPPEAEKLAQAYWPGPLTMILPKSPKIPPAVSAGLPTVAVRFPSHPVARKVIDAAGVPLAAPSANTSGLPSPTTAEHVMRDMRGKIDAIVDGGPCQVGVESTVITLATPVPRLLRPGGITLEMLRDTLGRVDMDDAVIHPMKEGEKAASPGMKYKHYSPRANVRILKGSQAAFVDYVNKHADGDTVVLCYNEEKACLHARCISVGDSQDAGAHAHRLFAALRTCDDMGARQVLAHCPGQEGVELAVYNRLIRAAGFEVVELG